MDKPCPVCGNEERHARTGLLTCECSAEARSAPLPQPDEKLLRQFCYEHCLSLEVAHKLLGAFCLSVRTVHTFHYPCGCSATGDANIPTYCPTHGKPGGGNDQVGEAAALPASSAPNGLYGESHLKCHGEDHLFPRFNPIRCQCGAREGAAEYKMEAAALPSSTAPDAYTQWLGRWSLVHGSGATPTLKDAFDGGVALLSAPSSTAPSGCISGCEDGTVTADVRALCPVHGKSTEQRVDASWLKVARENLDKMLAHVNAYPAVLGRWPDGYEVTIATIQHMLRAERDEADKSITHAARLSGGEIRDILQAVWRKLPNHQELRAELQQDILDIVNRGAAHAAKEEAVPQQWTEEERVEIWCCMNGMENHDNFAERRRNRERLERLLGLDEASAPPQDTK